jgi:diguanylate cyclase (GGDEF)-like protein
MSSKTDLALGRRLFDIYRGTMSNILGWIKAVFNRSLGKTDSYASVQEMLIPHDRRKPAYMQLRNAWDTLDSVSQKESVGWILQKTMIDPLSGLETLVAKELSGQRPADWVEAISDLNSLKAINDTWGHEAGDQVLRELGKIVKVEVDREGGRAFRVGGDEISYWFSDAKAAKRALKAIDARFQAEAFMIGGRKRKGFSVSYGIGSDAISADNALYLDKERRKKLGQRAARGQIPESIALYYASRITITFSGG